MFNVTITPPDDVLSAINETISTSPTLMNTAFNRAASRLNSRMLNDLRREPGAAHYPIRWTSERQRRAFFASNGFGGGIPYIRTGALSAAWEVDFDSAEDGGVITVGNDSPAVRYVQGDDAQMMHLDTGWPQAAPIIAGYAEQYEDVLIETWFTVSDVTAGV